MFAATMHFFSVISTAAAPRLTRGREVEKSLLLGKGFLRSPLVDTRGSVGMTRLPGYIS
jgi:hypothetical protein